MFCTKCGSELAGEEKFCSKCGNSVHGENSVDNRITLNENIINNKTNEKASQANIGLILGLCSILAWFIPLIGYPVTISGIVFSAKGLDSDNKGKAIVGLILSIIFLGVTLINSIAGAVMMSNIRLYY